MKNSANQSLIFLPGWGFKSSIWNNTLKLLSSHDVKAIDLPALNETTDLKSVINELSKNIPANSTIIAWSLSGLIAIYFCYCLPHQCHKLILVSSLPKFISTPDWIGIPAILAKRFQQQAKTNLDKLLRQFVNLVEYPHHSEFINSYTTLHTLDAHANQTSLINYLDFIVNADCCDFLKKLTQRVHFIFGANDAVLPIQAAAQITALNTNIPITIIPEAGHLLFLTHHQIFTQLLTGILNE